ncbi:hypothetical protein T08_632 [Trichinella sp. T8]|nr:hypothetical protein T08_632 [Trichinella sp. T8]
MTPFSKAAGSHEVCFGLTAPQDRILISFSRSCSSRNVYNGLSWNDARLYHDDTTEFLELEYRRFTVGGSRVRDLNLGRAIRELRIVEKVEDPRKSDSPCRKDKLIKPTRLTGTRNEQVLRKDFSTEVILSMLCPC